MRALMEKLLDLDPSWGIGSRLPVELNSTTRILRIWGEEIHFKDPEFFKKVETILFKEGPRTGELENFLGTIRDTIQERHRAGQACGVINVI